MLLFRHSAGVISVKCLSLGCRLVEGLVLLVGIRSSCLAMFFFHFEWVQSPSRLHLTFQRVQTFLPYYYVSVFFVFFLPSPRISLFFLPVVDCAGFCSCSWHDLCRPLSAWRSFAHRYDFRKKPGVTTLTKLGQLGAMFSPSVSASRAVHALSRLPLRTCRYLVCDWWSAGFSLHHQMPSGISPLPCCFLLLLVSF